jgi:hypothetical protein
VKHFSNNQPPFPPAKSPSSKLSREIGQLKGLAISIGREIM